MTEASIPRVAAPSVTALARGELVGLDGLRALSVLAVMVGHFGFGKIVPGGLGVTVFFFISGFLITTLMLREVRSTGKVNIGRFYLRRVLRLQPELWAFLLISVGLGALFAQPTRLIDVLGAIFYFSNYIFAGILGQHDAGLLRWPQLWSLAIEEHYYLTYPLIFSLLIATPKRLMLLISAVLAAALALRFAYHQMGVSENYIYAATETRIDSIAYGCFAALAVWHLPGSVKSLIERFGVGNLILALVLLGGSLAIRQPMFRDTLRYSLQGLAICSLFAFLFITPLGGQVARWLDCAPLKWMGRMSYGAYLWHIEIAGLVERTTGMNPPDAPSLRTAINCVILTVLTFVVAWISFSLFQRPLLALRHRLGAQV